MGGIALSVLAWGYLIMLGGHGAAAAPAIDARPFHPSAAFLFAFLMWSVMMVAMMLPSAIPTVLLFETIARKQVDDSGRPPSTVLFIAGYLIIWTVYSGFAAIGQLWLQHAGLIATAMAKSAPTVSAIIPIVAGLFQFTPLKSTCLKHCQSPMGFFMLHWRKGQKGALLMGLRSGMYCVGCCWALMVLMFVAGGMNMLWMAGLALFVLIEKLAPGGRRFSRLSGLLMIAWGIWIGTRI